MEGCCHQNQVSAADLLMGVAATCIRALPFLALLGAAAGHSQGNCPAELAALWQCWGGDTVSPAL